MKVIVQDISTKQFLAEDGGWVESEIEARDFFTLLRAFHFATGRLLGRFQVLLHCPDDDYSACIIEGEGMARVSAPVTQIQKVSTSGQFYRNAVIASRLNSTRGNRLDASKNYLN